jgi:hypothetical protein
MLSISDPFSFKYSAIMPSPMHCLIAAVTASSSSMPDALFARMSAMNLA